jgi:hypothetical protein
MPDTRVGILDRFKQLFAAEAARWPKKDRAEFETQSGASMFGELARILEQSTSSRQRAAAFKALAYVPGVQMLGNRKDVTGRTGLAIRYVFKGGGGAGQVQTLIVDPHSGDLLQDATSDVRPANHLTVAQSLNRTVYFTRSIVKSMTALPRGGSVPYHGVRPTIVKGTTTK